MFEPVAVNIVDFVYDFFAGGGEILVRFGGFVDEYECSFGVDAETMEKFIGKASFFDKPAGIDFVAIFAVINRITFGFGNFGFCFGEIDVFEEGARAGFLQWIGEFVGTDGADDGADALGGEISRVVIGDVFFDGAVERAGHLAGLEF